jgi:hypothetical protein
VSGFRQGFLEVGDMLPSKEDYYELDFLSEFDSQITHTCIPFTTSCSVRNILYSHLLSEIPTPRHGEEFFVRSQ